MYGTVSRMQVKPGMLDTFVTWAKGMATPTRPIPGHIQTTVYQMDADPNTLMLAVVFESREAYHANAASPEQHVEYLKMMEFLAAEPEWHDGEIIYYLTGGGRGKEFE